MANLASGPLMLTDATVATASFPSSVAIHPGGDCLAVANGLP
jgi:hypothetical protein